MRLWNVFDYFIRKEKRGTNHKKVILRLQIVIFNDDTYY